MSGSGDETFDEFRLRREIEMMEQRFQKRASVQRRRVKDLLEGNENTEEIERKVQVEMEEFLKDSTAAAEQVLRQYAGNKRHTERAQEELRNKFEGFLSGVQGAEAPAAPREAVPVEPPLAEAPSTPESHAAPAESADRRPFAESAPPERPRDLKSALERLRRGSGSQGPPPRVAMPDIDPPPAPAGAPSEVSQARTGILQDFDATLSQFSDIIASRMDEGAETGLADGESSEPPGPVLEAPLAFDAEQIRVSPGELPPISHDSEEVDIRLPPGMKNVFEAEPGEDRDIDAHLEAVEPEGWDLPSAPEAPGAWVVARQKEEGEAGMAGMAGDTYLMKKLSGEVRQLNRLYLALLRRDVVTREEVEGPAGAGGAEDDDEGISVDDYADDRYRPVLTTDQGFSLSGLVADVHRLKTLRAVLVKKKVISEKELKKAED